MKKVLIITYYWPPSGGGGVQRWLKFSKYFKDYGWDITIFTADNADYPVIDKSLINEVPKDVKTIRNPIWEPYSLYKKFTGRKKEEKVYSGFINEKKGETWIQKLSIFIRGNFFIPDARRFWIKPSIKRLTHYLERNNIDAIVSTGPPHSTHMIALGLKREFNIPWIADFRDPWTNIDFYDQLRLTGPADKKHKSLELKVLNSADKIVTVSWSWADDFKRISGREDIRVITNGYDEMDFQGPNPVLTEKFTICHVGSMNKDRNPVVLWKALSALIEKGHNLRDTLQIVLIGQVDFSILQSIDDNGLTKYLLKRDFLPHKEVVKELRTMRVLLLPINDTPNAAGVLPGKLYEYLGANRPILCIGPKQSDSARILSEIDSSEYVGYNDLKETEDAIKELHKSFVGDINAEDQMDVLKYSRRVLAKKYVQLLNHFN